MASVTYNGQSFAIDNRRIWILGASLAYARIPAALWAERIAAAKQAGFNTIETPCPWLIHEPRRGRFNFENDADLRGFIQLCDKAGMRVLLRLGPHVGSGFDGGGIPGWLIETPGVKLRESNELFLEAVSRFFRRLISEIADLQVTNNGPVLLVQVEHGWTCSNEAQGERYLHEITRFVREGGITVPIINANDLWQESPGTIDTWRGYEDLLVNLRQLRIVQPTAPRIVSTFDPATLEIWGEDQRARRGKGAKAEQSKLVKSPQDVLRRLAEVLAAGAQPVVSPFHGGTNFDFLGGRLPGCPDAFIATSGAADAPLGEAGARTPKYQAIKRLMMFANHFAPVLAELDPDYQPVVLDLAEEEVDQKRGAKRGKRSEAATPGHRSVSVVPLRGPQGRVVFVFADAPGATATLVLDDGIRLPVRLGDQTVGWYVMNVDLQGLGRLDVANVSPWAIVDRSIVVFHGPADSLAYISIDGTPLEATVPADGPGGAPGKPVVLEHKGMTIVVCSERQIDMTYHDDTAVYVGIGGFSADGAPLPAPGFDKAWVIRKDARIESLSFAEGDGAGGGHGQRRGTRSESAAISLEPWQAAPATEYVNGQSPRFASLDGPETLSACGAPLGYGWYRVTLNGGSGGGRRTCFAPHAADRLHLYINGEFHKLVGIGPGAAAGPFELKLAKGSQALVALVDNLGRFADGNDQNLWKGLYGHIYEIKPLRSAKPKVVTAQPVSPFELRGFIAQRSADQVSDSRQAAWAFAHTKKSPILLAVNGARISGTFVLNDEALAYYAGATGGCMISILIDSKGNPSLKRGKNVLRFAPDLRQSYELEELMKATTLYECVDVLTESGGWAFAKWEPPAVTAYSSVERHQVKELRGQPCWWRTTFTYSHAGGKHLEGPVWLETAGLSKGQAFVNGRNLGRYFTATADGKGVGPQTRFYVPAPWLKFDQPNELVLFDEHGFEPSRVRLMVQSAL